MVKKLDQKFTNELKNKIILVTGGAGYLGSILSKKLLEKGYRVRVMDTMWYGNKSIADCMKNKNFELINDDIRNLIATVKAMKDVDSVIHLASIVGMPASNIDPRTSEEVNYLATKNIAELCQLHGIETYVFASTCSVYGSQPDKFITEKSPVAPLDYYAKQKFLSERAIGWLNRAPTILRFGTLFGISSRMRFDLVINLFIAQALTEGKVTVFGGSQYRPFLHVDDAAESVILCLENDLTGTYNVVSENLTIMQAAEIISKITGCTIEVSKEKEDFRNYKVSGKKINQMGFSPKKKIEDAVEEIKNALNSGKVTRYDDIKYNNFKVLLNSKEIQKKIFIHGL